MPTPSPSSGGSRGSGTDRAPRTAPTPAAPVPASGGSAAAPAGGAVTAPPAPLNKTIIQSLIAGLDRVDMDIADPLASSLEAEGLTQTQFDARYSDAPAVRGAILQKWFEGGAGAAIVRTKVHKVAEKDPIAVQKLADVDAEGYLENPSLKDQFYTELAGKLQNPSLDRTRVYPIMSSMMIPTYVFKGVQVPSDRVSPFQSRNQGVHKLYEIQQIDVEIAQQIEDDWVATGKPLAALPPTAKGDPALRKKAYRHILGGGRAPMRTIDTGQPITSWGTWYAPGEITTPAGSAETAYGELMQLGALQPEWYPEGTVVLNIERKVAAGARELRKPTAFDGMMSALWTARNQPGEVYGVTGGGQGEFLEANVPYADVTSATAVIPNDDFLSEIQRLAAAVPDDSSVGEELLRGNAVGTNLTTDLYQGVLDRSTEEANNPGNSPVAPGAATPGGGGAAAPGSAAVTPGGTFDRSRQKRVR